MNMHQLTLWDWLEEAADLATALPEQIVLSDGLAVFEAALAQLPANGVQQHLALGAEALAQFCDLLERKSDLWLMNWQEPAGAGIELSADWLDGLVRQPVSFDLSALVEQPEPLTPAKRQRPTASSPVVRAVEPEQLLEMLELMGQEPELLQQSLALFAGGETPGQWQEQIDRVLYDQSGALSFEVLQQQTGLAIVELWLGLLLGGYVIDSSATAADFYRQPIELLIQKP
jgi:hypothetical protein